MSIIILLITPLIGLISICSSIHYSGDTHISNKINIRVKYISLVTSIVALLISLFIFILFHFSNNYFQFVQNANIANTYNISFGIDGSSVYFVLLTTVIMPISLLSNWNSITEKIKAFSSIILLLETLLLCIFLVLDSLLFYVFFESILPPLFVLIGIFGSDDRVRAAFYLFLYTLLGSLFMLLSILKISSISGYTQYDAIYKSNIINYLQLFMFIGIFIAFAVKTPTIFLNSWLLKAHVESPLSGSIILAAIVLKLSLYGIFRLILPLLAKVCIISTKTVYVIGFITIIYGSASTIRTVDVKELIAYSSVCHAAVYLMGVFTNVVTGIEGGIILGLAHGFVSSGLFICVGGVLYDRTSTRIISIYRGMTQLMPIFSILLFILCLGNCGAPLTLNFVGEFMSLYGIFERHLIYAPLASLSIILSAVYTIYLFNRIAFAGPYSKYFIVNIPDLNKREFYILFTLVTFTIIFGIYPAPILDGIHYSTSTLIYSTPAMIMFTLPIKYYVVEQRLFLDIMYTVINKAQVSLQSGLNNPPKPHAFVSLSLQSNIISNNAKLLSLYFTVKLSIFFFAFRFIMIDYFGFDLSYLAHFSILVIPCSIVTPIIVYLIFGQENFSYKKSFIISIVFALLSFLIRTVLIYHLSSDCLTEISFIISSFLVSVYIIYDNIECILNDSNNSEICMPLPCGIDFCTPTNRVKNVKTSHNKYDLPPLRDESLIPPDSVSEEFRYASRNKPGVIHPNGLSKNDPIEDKSHYLPPLRDESLIPPNSVGGQLRYANYPKPAIQHPGDLYLTTLQPRPNTLWCIRNCHKELKFPCWHSLISGTPKELDAKMRLKGYAAVSGMLHTAHQEQIEVLDQWHRYHKAPFDVEFNQKHEFLMKQHELASARIEDVEKRKKITDEMVELRSKYDEKIEDIRSGWLKNRESIIRSQVSQREIAKQYAAKIFEEKVFISRK